MKLSKSKFNTINRGFYWNNRLYHLSNICSPTNAFGIYDENYVKDWKTGFRIMRMINEIDS